MQRLCFGYYDEAYNNHLWFGYIGRYDLHSPTYTVHQPLHTFIMSIKLSRRHYKKPLKTVWPDCKAATKFEKIHLEQT